MWNLVLVCLETVLVSLQDRCTVCAKYTRGSKIFWMQQIILLGDEAELEARQVHSLHSLEIVLILTQDRCTVCAEHSIGSEIILDTPDGTLR
jgi:hypothetical protein